ncbi:MAG: alpha/beta hydrolase [Pseudomonadota bacterium]|nr:alpha/beta hydrolase [Pseudomonadota bacterium]
MKWLGRILLGVVLLLLGVYLFVRTPDTDPAAMRAKYGGAPSQFLALGNGLTVHVRDEGPRDAPVIVLLHGSNADLHTWDLWAQMLTAKYRVIRFDQIGHGLTGPAPRSDYSPQAFDATIEQVADKLGLTKFALAGNSMGGGNALHYALGHADRLTALILIDSGGAPPFGKQPGNIGFTLARTPVLRNLILHITPRSLVEQSLQQSVFNQAVATPGAVDRYWELLRYPGNRQATLDRFGRGFTTFAQGDLAALRLPVLILWGAHDRIISPQAAQWFHQGIFGSKLIVYPDAGHLPHEEVAQRSAADVAAFLQAVASPPR